MSGPIDMQAAVDRLAAAVGQSVLVEDADQRPLWWSTIGAVDKMRMRSIVNRYVDPLATAARLGIADADRPVRTPALPAADMWARWCLPVRRDGRLLGYL